MKVTILVLALLTAGVLGMRFASFVARVAAEVERRRLAQALSDMVQRIKDMNGREQVWN